MRLTPWLLTIICGLGAISPLRAQDLLPDENEPPAMGQELLGILIGGTGTTPTTAQRFWVSAPDPLRAVAVGQLVAIGLNPLTSGWAQISFDDRVEMLPPEGYLPARGLSLAAESMAIFGGNLPTSLTQPGGGGGGGGGGAGAISPDGLPLLGVKVNASPEGGPTQVGVTVQNPDGTIDTDVGISIPRDGWWVVGLGPADTWLLENGKLPSTIIFDPKDETPDTDDPTPIETQDPSPGVATPEPGTLALAGIGAATFLGFRRTRRPI